MFETSFSPTHAAAAEEACLAARATPMAQPRLGLPQPVAARIEQALELLARTISPQRRVVHEGDRIYRAGERFVNLYVINSGLIKLINLAADGREQVAGVKFRGDWLGLDGIADGEFACDAIAMDTGEVWVLGYDKLLKACAREPSLMNLLHKAMSRQIASSRDSLMSICTLPADARVADFLRFLAESLAERGLRTDQILLRMTRAEIGNYLGMTLESVSRALSRLARDKVIAFAGKGRRDVQIPDIGALSSFIQRCLASA